MCRNGNIARFSQISGMADMIAFSANPLDRASARRGDEAWLAAQAVAGRVLPFWRDKPLVKDGRAAQLPWRESFDGLPRVFLGLDGATGVFAVALESGTPPEGGAFEEMRAAAFILPAGDTAIAGQGKAMLDWHARHGFCATCGHATDMREGGWRRDCPHCGAQHFPRTDPVAIMLPVFEDSCLMGRNARFQNGLYSAFAGFVEPGETMEEAVVRELAEEAGIAVGAVRYHQSQPWPFPSALMLGCYADATGRDFRIDGEEIVDARWFSRDEARARLAGTISDEMRMPGTIAIAHRLLRDWVETP
jgi:NAD+ diphosphatase